MVLHPTPTSEVVEIVAGLHRGVQVSEHGGSKRDAALREARHRGGGGCGGGGVGRRGNRYNAGLL